MTILGAALNLLTMLCINSAALKMPPNPDTEVILLQSDDVIDYDGEPDDVSLWNEAHHTRSPSGWRVKPGEGMKSLGIMHIPKTAGTSFTLDAPGYLPSGVGLFAAEYSIGGIKQIRNIDEIVTFVRHPTSHVYSQFLELADDSWGKQIVKDRSKVKNVTHWLKHFLHGDSIKTNDFGGYHPFNLQARSFNNNGQDNHHYHAVDIDQAIANMKKIKFVGITEYYHESMCIFFDKVQPTAAMPKWCDCKSPEWSSQFAAHHDSHGVRKHSLKDLSERDLGMIAKLTKKDEALYKEALNRFLHEIDELENRRPVKLSCAWKA